ncbi:MAG: isoprenylcysteine carboxylmethyltransferase family protein [Bacteroidales bacterium]|nr:isoprenylcysteine carboxylmethyltransferase family protein [Bacteroidales bacterium]
MALIQTYERTGNFLFKYRGQIPVLIMVAAAPIIFFTNHDLYNALSLNPTMSLRVVLTVIAILVTLCGLILRAYTVSTTPKGTSGRNTQKQVAQHLNTKGIYSIVRHPLYLANYLIWAGTLIFTMNVWAFIIVSLIYWVYYERIMFAEEAFLRQQFGQEFENWAAVVPAFIPKCSLFQKGDMQFSFKTFVRREYVTIFSTIFTFVAADYFIFLCIQYQSEFQNVCARQWLRPSLWILLASLVVMLVIRTIKHHTTLLKSDKTRD